MISAYKKYGAIIQKTIIIARKIKSFFSGRTFLPPLPVILFLLLGGIAIFCIHQQRQLSRTVSINTCLRHTIHRQYTALLQQEKILVDQKLENRQQETALLNLTHRIEAMTTQVALMHEQTIRLVQLEKEVKKLTKTETPPHRKVCTGMGGSSQLPFTMLSLSLNPSGSSPASLENNLNVLQQEMKITHQGLSQHIRRFQGLRDELEIRNDILACTPSIKPTRGIISCGFGERTSPFSGKKEFHTGMDIASAKGTQVVASARGTVIFARYKWLIGNLIVIDHGNGIITKYGHLDKFMVKKGDVVDRGDIIGLMGNTGQSTGPHLHYEVVVNGKSENPAHYFSNELTASAP